MFYLLANNTENEPQHVQPIESTEDKKTDVELKEKKPSADDFVYEISLDLQHKSEEDKTEALEFDTADVEGSKNEESKTTQPPSAESDPGMHYKALY